MTKAKNTKDTTEQLRMLIAQHAKTQAHEPVPVVVSPMSKPEVSAERISPVNPNPRCTVRLSISELDRLDQIILQTHQEIGERITMSDVLRIGLKRVGSSTPISLHDVASLKTNDRRRTERAK